MPTYEYECTNGHTFEVVQRITEEPLKRCRQCRAKAQRLISAPSFILKGGGWYSDGYSSSSSSSASASASDGSNKSSSSSSSSSDTKSTSTSESAKSSSSSSSSSSSD